MKLLSSTRLMIFATLLLLSTAASPQSAASEKPRVEIASVYPRVAIGPSDVRVKVLVRQHPDNRELNIHVLPTGDSWFGHSSSRQLDEHSPYSFLITAREVPSGTYDVYAEIVLNTGKTISSTRVPLELR